MTVLDTLNFVAVLDMISKHKVKNNSITTMGNNDLLYVNFSNDVAEIQVYIPSCSITGKRNAKYFTKFVTND